MVIICRVAYVARARTRPAGDHLQVAYADKAEPLTASLIVTMQKESAMQKAFREARTARQVSASRLPNAYWPDNSMESS